ncbi:hypothetical protein AtEden1_Chr5g0092801 [Arabidopsis thaliana]
MNHVEELRFYVELYISRIFIYILFASPVYNWFLHNQKSIIKEEGFSVISSFSIFDTYNKTIFNIYFACCQKLEGEEKGWSCFLGSRSFVTRVRIGDRSPL